MEREINFKIPTACTNERIISVNLIGQSGGFMRLLVKSCNPDFKAAARVWLAERNLLAGAKTRVLQGFSAVVNRQGNIGIACYHKGDSIPYDSHLGVYLAIADSYGVKQEMMKDIGMV